MASQRRRGLVSKHHGILEKVCPLSSRCHSEDPADSWREKTMITVFFTAKKFIMFDVLPTGSTFNRLYFPIWKQYAWIFGARGQGQLFGWAWIIPCAITDRRLRQKLRRVIFPECVCCILIHFSVYPSGSHSYSSCVWSSTRYRIRNLRDNDWKEWVVERTLNSNENLPAITFRRIDNVRLLSRMSLPPEAAQLHEEALASSLLSPSLHQC
jgi:hypothetical protein